MSIFGTDGVRGPAGVGVLSPQEVLRLGAAFAAALGGQGTVVVARDTRRSGGALNAALVAGLCGAGCDVLDLGVLPTPALSWTLSRTEGAVGGVMVTASHNAWMDNGLKLFAGDGTKVSGAVQDDTEARYLAMADAGDAGPFADVPGHHVDGHMDARGGYLQNLTGGRGRDDLAGRTVVIDHASGAAWQVLGPALRALGAHVISWAPRPDGVNINDGVGAVHPQATAARVLEHEAWAGVCVDGDGDRIVLIDEQGEIRDGDSILGFLAGQWQDEGALGGDAVVGTVATGMGLQAFLTERGLTLHRTDVGDRHVAARMTAEGLRLGGESSGHVITPDLCPSGDGTRVAVEVLVRIARAGMAPSVALGAVPRFPAAHRKVPAPVKPPLDSLTGLSAVLAEADAALTPLGGRQLLRYSGTESILRVLVEGPQTELVEGWASRLAEAAGDALAAAAS